MSESGLGSPAAVSTSSRLSLFLDRVGLQGFPWVSAIVLYTISWGWLFIVRDSYWADDWDYFKFRGITDFDYRTLGFAPWSRINLIIFDTFGPEFLRLLIFIIFFSSAVLLYGIIKDSELLDSSQRKFLVLLFLILPFNSARLSLNTFIYSIAYLYFFLAWFVLVRFGTFKSKFLSLVLFFLSFQMFANLVFFLLPVANMYFLEGRGSLRVFLNWTRRYLLFLLAPLIYWALRTVFWSGSGNYHDITSNKINGFFRFLLIVAVTFIFLILGFIWSKEVVRRRITLVIISWGAIVVGYLPYVFFGLVGYGFKVPMTYLVTMLGRSDWFSRHQIIQPLGFSLFLISLVYLLPSFSNKFRRLFLSMILVISVVFNIAFGFEYVVDFKKQTLVVAALGAEPNKTAGNEVQMVDQTTLLNARGRSYRERDWLGLVGLAEGVDSAKKLKVVSGCSESPNVRLVLIQGPETHWQALKNWVRDRDMGFKVTIDDTPGACKPEMVTAEKVSGAIPILFYFTGVKN